MGAWRARAVAAAVLAALAAGGLRAQPRGKKIVLIAGPITGHPKHTHEYEKNVILLKHLLDTSPNVRGLRTVCVLRGWPEDESVLDDADTIFMTTDGGDRRESDHPLYVGNRLQVLERQMKRGCGLVQFHWSTFHPAKHHDRITEWVGGYFDYETGKTPNRWYSAIQTWEGPTALGTPGHPISRGVKPFTVKEEFYYNVRFRENDDRLRPILLTRPPKEERDHAVGWAVERKDGGRGFGFTGGHFYDNWWNPDFRRLILNAIVWSAGIEVPSGGVESRLAPPYRALIVTGYHHPGHDWRRLTKALIAVLEQDPRVRVEVTENVEDLGSDRLNACDLIVLNYNNWDRAGLSRPAQERFLRALRTGKGLVLVHFANGAFNYSLPRKDSEWKEFRTSVVARAWMHDQDSGHDPFGRFRVEPARGHDIVDGLAPFGTEDELYFRQKGDRKARVLATARSRVTGRDEPMAWAYNYGAGRVFQTVLGHADVSIHHAGALIRRGAAWAADQPRLTFDPPLEYTPQTLFRSGSAWTLEGSLQGAPPVERGELDPQHGPGGRPAGMPALPGQGTPPAERRGEDRQREQGGRPAGMPALPGPGPQGAAPGGQIVLADGMYGKALDARRGGALAPGRAAFAEKPLTVELWARLFGKKNFNILVASEPKNSATHWELFTMPGTGYLTAYIPFHVPDHIRTAVDVCDGRWRHVGLLLTNGRGRIFVDGRQVADQQLSFQGGQSVPGPLGIGQLPTGELGCDGLIDDLRISSSDAPIRGIPGGPAVADDTVVALWRFDGVEGGRLAETSRSPAAVSPGAGVGSPPEPRKAAGPLPAVDPKTSIDWPFVAGDAGGMRYSRLKQINRANVAYLKPAWEYRTGEESPGSTIECTPIVIEGVMYLTTVRLNVVALDAATGREIWRYDPKTSGVNRGLAYWSDGKKQGERRILMGTPDGRLISLDARSGRLDPAFGNGGTVDLRAGYSRDLKALNYGCTSAPVVFEDLVYLPITNSEGMPGAPGDIRAFNVRTGKEAWRFHTTPLPGEFGNDTWEGDSWRDRSGNNAWGGYTLDRKNGILFAGIGSPAPDFYGGERKGANLFGNCVLALNARTGKRLWHFQVVRHDLWDHDNPCPPVVCTVRQGRRSIDVVAQVTKTGFVYVLERKTGKPVFGVRDVPAPTVGVPGEQPYPTQPEPLRPPPFSRLTFTLDEVTDRTPEARRDVLERLKKLRYGRHEPPSLEGTVVFPGFHGGATWSGAAVDPETGFLYVNSNDVPWLAQLKRNPSGGYDFMGYGRFEDKDGYPAVKPPWGQLNAIDLNSGEFAWRTVFGEYPELRAQGVPPTGVESFGGAIVTAGGLVFIGGTRDEKFHAYDKATGKLLWEAALPAGGYATPCTYQVNGKQFVVIAAGGGGKLRTRSDDRFIAFALP